MMQWLYKINTEHLVMLWHPVWTTPPSPDVECTTNSHRSCWCDGSKATDLWDPPNGRWQIVSFAFPVSKAHPHYPMSVLHIFPLPSISEWIYLSAVSFVIARFFVFLDGWAPIHPSILRPEVTSSIPKALSFIIIIPLMLYYWNLCLLPLLGPLVAVSSISAGTKLCLSSVLC